MSQIGNASVKLLRLVQENKFPKPVRVTVPNMTVWPSDKIEQWVQTQLAD